MPEDYPHSADTNGSIDPTLPIPIEVTRHDLDTAGFQDVPAAIDNYTFDIHNKLDSTTSPSERKYLEQKIEHAALANDWSIKWFKNNQERTRKGEGHETFKGFLDRTLEEDTHPVALEQAYAVSGLISSPLYDKFLGDVIRERRQGEVLEAAPKATPEQVEQPTHEPDTGATQQAAEAKRTLDVARESVEKARGIEVIDDIVKFAKDKTALYTDVVGGYKQVGGMNVVSTEQIFIPHSLIEGTSRDPDYRQHLNEAVMFEELLVQDTHMVTRERQVKGKFGRAHTEPYQVREAIPGSEHPILIHNEQTGMDEPTIRFRYGFKYSQAASKATFTSELPRYTEFQGGRDGQMINVMVDLPKSLAETLQAQIERDPASVRALSERLFLSNSDGRITEEYWHNGGPSGNPIRPPYEGLPNDWTIAMITRTKKSGTPSQDHSIKRLSLH